MKKETEKLLNNYLKQVKNSMEYMPKSEVDERLNTIRNHILDAIEDQKGELDEIKIVENAIKELGMTIKTKRTKKDILLDFLGYGIIGIFIIILDWLFFYPRFQINASIPYFVIILPAALGWEIWNFTVKPRLTDPRYNLIYAWIFYPVLIIELLFVGLPDPIPFIGILVYGILLILGTILSVAIPGEILEKQCPKCNEVLPKKARYCLMCGEEQE